MYSIMLKKKKKNTTKRTFTELTFMIIEVENIIIINIKKKKKERCLQIRMRSDKFLSRGIFIFYSCAHVGNLIINIRRNY